MAAVGLDHRCCPAPGDLPFPHVSQVFLIERYVGTPDLLNLGFDPFLFGVWPMTGCACRDIGGVRDALFVDFLPCCHEFLRSIAGRAGDLRLLKCEATPSVVIGSTLPKAGDHKCFCGGIFLLVLGNNPTAKPPALLERLTAVQHWHE